MYITFDNLALELRQRACESFFITIQNKKKQENSIYNFFSSNVYGNILECTGVDSQKRQSLEICKDNIKSITKLKHKEETVYTIELKNKDTITLNHMGIAIITNIQQNNTNKPKINVKSHTRNKPQKRTISVNPIEKAFENIRTEVNNIKEKTAKQSAKTQTKKIKQALLQDFTKKLDAIILGIM
jgi:hypothetical protein